MGRRSDHSRAQLKTLILDAGTGLIAESGLAGFAAREVARRIGYSIGTIHNVFGTSDQLIAAINTRSFEAWTTHLRERLHAAGQGDRIAALVEGYFGFARSHTHLWNAIHDHRPATGDTLSEEDRQARAALTGIVVAEVARALGRAPDDRVSALSRSLIATVHGHCAFAIGGTWAALGEDSPEAAALDRVRDSLAREPSMWRI